MKESETSRNLLFVQAGIFAIGWILLLFAWNKLPPEIPWFYSLPWGEEQLASKFNLALIFGGITVVTLATTKLPDWTKKGDRVILNTVLVTTILLATLTVLNLLKVLSIFIF